MDRIIAIIAKRDKLTTEEATMTVNAFVEEANSYIENGDTDGLEDLLMEQLGLEPDYLPELLGLF